MAPSSNPPNANTICDQKFSLSRFHSGRSRRGVAEPNRIHHQAQPDQQRASQIGRQAAQIASPLPDAQADDVGNGSDPQDRERRRQNGGPVLRKPHGRGCHSHARQQKAREVEQVAEPVAPPAQEAVPIAESATRPDIDAALLRKTLGQRRHRERQGDEEQPRRQHPQRDRARTGVGRRRQPADADHRRNVEKDKIPHPQLTPQRGIGGGVVQACSGCWQPKVGGTRPPLFSSLNPISVA